MNSKLLIHPDLNQRIEAIQQILMAQQLKMGHPDVLWMDEEKLGVEQAKIIREFLSLKPYSAKGRVVAVLNSQNFTPDAQNSLLKILEEPPEKATILLGADSDKKILPTILSRCQIVILDHKLQISPSPLKGEGRGEGKIEKLQKMSIEQRFEFVEKLEDKDAFLDELVTYFHHQLTTDHSALATQFMKDLLHAEAWRDANGNIRAILEYLMLKMPT